VETTITGNRIQTNKAEAFDIRCAAEGVTMKDNESGKEATPVAKPEPPESTGPAWRK
jgi:hypothetical protein